MRVELVLPNLDLGDRPIVASVWLVDVGSEVSEGDRLLEIQSDSVTIDLASPASGTLIETLVSEDDPLTLGQTLAIIESNDAASE
jgi:pyruvate/2-oxoglutarate dehydrogenase complex dihydrolipoamide acyltransferase (E2) component